MLYRFISLLFKKFNEDYRKNNDNIFPDVIHENKFTRIIIKLWAHIFQNLAKDYVFCLGTILKPITARPNLLTFLREPMGIGFPGGNIGTLDILDIRYS